jgi:uncharacterized protein
MSAPAVIDTLEFARAEQQLTGNLPVVSLSRLDDVLHDREGTLRYEVRGGRDERMRPQLRLRISGRLHLQCQRCLELLDFPLDVISRLLVAREGEALEGIDDPHAPDAIEAQPELDVASLIEDEVLLALPLAPRHAPGECASKLDTQGDEADDERSAFAKLAALKRPHNEIKES